MMKTWWPLLIFAVWGLFSRYIYVCFLRDNQCCETRSVGALPQTNNLSLILDGKTLLDGYDQFAFATNNVAPELVANNKEFLEKTAAYLKLHPDQNLTITGYYKPDESQESVGIYENLGIARAATVRTMLVERGIPELSMQIDGKRLESTDPTQSLTFDITHPDMVAEGETRAAPEQNSFFDINFRDVSFEVASAQFTTGTQFDTYADSLVTYCTANPAKTIEVVGHTDITSSEASNLKLGQKRAEAVRAYLKKMGIKNNIKASSKGETEPVDNTNTEAGNQRNRRVQIRIE